jgi:NADH dehydrogenase
MILVVGGTGFVGSAIARELASRGESVVVLSRNQSAAGRFSSLKVQVTQGDVTKPETLPGALAGIKTVVATQQFPNSPIEDPKKGYTFEKVDAAGTENLIAAALDAQVSRFVYLSGAGASPSGRHWFRMKWRAEEAVRSSGITYTILRPSWVYGPGDRALNRFIGMARFLPFVPQIGDISKQKMQPVFVEDVARAVAESIQNPAAENKVFEVGGPDVYSMQEVVAAAIKAAGRKRMLLAAPKGIMKAAASVLQFMPGRPLTPDAVDFITTDALANPTELEQALGLRMTPLKQGLASYMGTTA